MESCGHITYTGAEFTGKLTNLPTRAPLPLLPYNVQVHEVTLSSSCPFCCSCFSIHGPAPSSLPRPLLCPCSSPCSCSPAISLLAFHHMLPIIPQPKRVKERGGDLCVCVCVCVCARTCACMWGLHLISLNIVATSALISPSYLAECWRSVSSLIHFGGTTY